MGTALTRPGADSTLGAHNSNEQTGETHIPIPIETVEQAWSAIFLAGDDRATHESENELSASACGFEHALFYRGPRLLCDLLITVAREQTGFIHTLGAFSDGSQARYFTLKAPHDFLYVRRLPHVLHSDSDITTNFDEDATSRSMRRISETMPQHAIVEDTLFFAVMGKRNVVQAYSERLDLVLDALQEASLAEAPSP